MVHFSKLRLHGFKSFADKTELEIAPGLNGVVGPNGCGKSNLVEALRWVMGESSAKRMRGDGMESVIFAGTEKRSGRNIAEVSLLLDNSDKSAPSPYTALQEIEVTRRIERDHGSNYKVNGRNVRARDVQMLFADTASGANSPALVSQGQVASIINAKPLDRRMILEDSAGVSGLNTRRHEAKLRLNATEKNLQRVEDLLGSMQSRLNGLRRQSRQASRYRSLSAQIKQMELVIAHLDWEGLCSKLEDTRKNFNQAESEVAAKLLAVNQLTKTLDKQSEELPELRKLETEILAELQTKKIASQQIEDEQNRLDQARSETASQIESLEKDIVHERQTLEEGSQSIRELEKEHEGLLAEQNNNSALIEQKEKHRETAENDVQILSEKHDLMMKSEAEFTARIQSLEQQIAQNKLRLETLRSRLKNAQDELFEKEKNAGSIAIEPKEKQAESLLEEKGKIESLVEKTRDALKRKEDVLAESRRVYLEEKESYSKLTTEIETLQSFISKDSDENHKPVLESVVSKPGYERALSRALGDSLFGSLSNDSEKWWEALVNKEQKSNLPKGVQPLSLFIEEAPAPLKPVLDFIGVVSDVDTGNSLCRGLHPGHCLVTKDGRFWRWDGYNVSPEAMDSNEQLIKHNNNLQALLKKQPKLKAELDLREEKVESLGNEIDSLKSALSDLEKKLRDKSFEYNSLEKELNRLREDNIRFTADVQRYKDTIGTLSEDIKSAEAVLVTDKARLSEFQQQLNSSQDHGESLVALKIKLDTAREKLQQAIRDYDLTRQEENNRKARLHAIADERINLKNRTIRAQERLKELEARKNDYEAKLKNLKQSPDSFSKEKQSLLTQISEIESRHKEIAEKLSAREREVFDTTKALKEAEHTLSSAKERRAHENALLSSLKEQEDGMRSQIQDSFHVPPEKISDSISISIDEFDLSKAKAEKERAIKQRDDIGPVNLQADTEAESLQTEVDALTKERDDLAQALSELENAINKIDAEAKQRIVDAFESINASFKTLFARLFPGGQARLEMIDSDDILKSGLEIYAQPPGKALQSLSLLSGGEQALTSIALIFAMFLTNPSPICVLDEIDAPLDDANVDRLCTLLEEMVRTGKTRFLVITHHRMTMSRMNRLYGVTMSEKGVSQLVSVDLQQSFEFVEAA